MNKKEIVLLKSLNPCAKALTWMHTQASFREAWDTCHRSDWMLWALQKIGFEDDKKMRLFACACIRRTPLADGRTVWDLLTDERSRNAIEVAEKFARGEATAEELAHDAYAAADAAYAAYAAADAAYAADAAAHDAAHDAAYAAAYAAAHDAAYAAAYAAQANLLREWISWDTVEAAIEAYLDKNNAKKD